jgi:sigma-B regulation protein RsbU (phosphoserine phosphatase)
VCGSNLLTRIIIADVVGHGESVSKTSQWVYDLLVSNMNSPQGHTLLTELNASIVDYGISAMTTAAVAAFYLTDNNMHFAYAGHHEVLINRKDSSEWSPASAPKRDTVANLPLGVSNDVEFVPGHIALSPGDRMFLYTDGVIEAPNPHHELFGYDRLRRVLAGASRGALSDIRECVLEALTGHSGDPLAHDDVTFMAVEISEGVVSS